MMDLNPTAATDGNDLKSNDNYRIPDNITDSTVTWQTEDDVQKIKQKLKDALIRNRRHSGKRYAYGYKKGTRRTTWNLSLPTLWNGI